MFVMDKEEIHAEAKEILDKFAKALDGSGIKDGNAEVDRDEFERIEGSGEEGIGFREQILNNAPNCEGDFIKVEKGAWK
jgi:hypothetical protein